LRDGGGGRRGRAGGKFGGVGPGSESAPVRDVCLIFSWAWHVAGPVRGSVSAMGFFPQRGHHMRTCLWWHGTHARTHRHATPAARTWACARGAHELKLLVTRTRFVTQTRVQHYNSIHIPRAAPINVLEVESLVVVSCVCAPRPKGAAARSRGKPPAHCHAWPVFPRTWSLPRPFFSELHFSFDCRSAYSPLRHRHAANQ